MMTALMLCGCAQDKPLTFVAGSYETTYNGHNGPISIKTTFSDSCVTKIEVLSQEETPHIGDCAFDQLIPQIVEANGIGMDAISGHKLLKMHKCQTSTSSGRIIWRERPQTLKTHGMW